MAFVPERLGAGEGPVTCPLLPSGLTQTPLSPDQTGGRGQGMATVTTTPEAGHT